MDRRIYLTWMMAALSLAACRNQKSQEPEMLIHEEEESYIYVDTLTLHRTVFSKQLVCNGRLAAIQKCELPMPISGVLHEIYVKEGSQVQAGAVMASIDNKDKLLELEKAQREMERARVELQDKLIGLGYSGLQDNIAPDLRRRAEVTSGYYNAKYQLQSAETALKDCRLTAPFSGKVANIQGKLHQRTDIFCTLIDDSYFDVEFKVLEAEMTAIRLGTTIRINPFVDESEIISGTVTEINPTVDDRGLIRIKARVKNTSNALIDGMNVRVIVENEVAGAFVVPKEAVLERDGYNVVFMYKDGKAVWTYVDIAYSNLTEYAITGCERKDTEIMDGDVVIISGNLNLADDTDVKLSSETE